VLPGKGRTVQEVLRDMDQSGVRRAVLFAGDTAIGSRWLARAPSRFLLGASFPCDAGIDPNLDPCFPETDGWPDLKWLRSEYASGRMTVMGELYYVYAGIAPTDERLEPYWALAEEMDVPVVVHTGRRPRSTLPEGCCEHYNDNYGNPALLEPVLRRHPKLRIVLAHGAGPFLQETVALMKAHPNVYADMSVLNSVPPPSVQARWLRTMRQADLLNRVMFGSDNLPYDRSIKRLEGDTSLTVHERRGIYCENAARFLRLDPAVCTQD
jgi:hypothetical protein